MTLAYARVHAAERHYRYADDTMNRAVVADILRPLASRQEQDRYIVHATKDEYLVPEELIDRALHLIESIEAKSAWVGQLSSEDTAALLRFGEVVRRHVDALPEAISPIELVERNPAWAAIRTAAGECLETLGMPMERHRRGPGAA